MQNQDYYRNLEYPESNVEEPDKYLIANCAGLCLLNRKFRTILIYGREDFYLQYLISGNLKIWINDEVQIMRPGQFIVYYPHTPYCYELDNNGEIVYYWVHFTGSAAKVLVEQCGIPNKKIFDIGIKEDIINSFDGLFKEFIVRDKNFENAVASKLLSIFVSLNRNMEDNNLNNIFNNETIFQSIEYIHKNYNSKIMIEELAKIEHFSVSRYRSFFQQCTGVTPIDYIITLRLNRACELLNQSDLSIYEIADSVGYPDQLYFSRIFKKRIGMSPSQYRSVNKK